MFFVVVMTLKCHYLDIAGIFWSTFKSATRLNILKLIQSHGGKICNKRSPCKYYVSVPPWWYTDISKFAYIIGAHRRLSNNYISLLAHRLRRLIISGQFSVPMEMSKNYVTLFAGSIGTDWQNSQLYLKFNQSTQSWANNYNFAMHGCGLIFYKLAKNPSQEVFTQRAERIGEEEWLWV